MAASLTAKAGGTQGALQVNGTDSVVFDATGITSGGANIITAAQGTMIGVGQTWTDVTASRAMNTNYVNATGKPIMCAVRADRGGASTAGINITINGVATFTLCYDSNSGGGNRSAGGTIIPFGATYSYSVASEPLTSYIIWELR